MSRQELPGTPIDIAELQQCAFCRQGLAHDNNLVFYEVTISQCVIDFANVQRMHGLEMMTGNVELARVFSPDNTVARRLPATPVMVCLPCLVTKPALAVLTEREGNESGLIERLEVHHG